MKQLETDRLLIRQWRAEDFDPYAELCADADVMRYMGGSPLSRADAWRHMAMIIGHWQLKGFGHWAVELKHSGEFIGRLGFFEPEGWPDFELGWTISPKHQGKGYATEGAKAALDSVFRHSERQQVISLIHPDNIASQRVATKLGERHLGNIEVKGQRVRLYGITRQQHKF